MDSWQPTLGGSRKTLLACTAVPFLVALALTASFPISASAGPSPRAARSTLVGGRQQRIELDVKAGDMRNRLVWRAPSSATAAGFSVFRSTCRSGPFAKISGKSAVKAAQFVDSVAAPVLYYYYVSPFSSNSKLCLPSEVVSNSLVEMSRNVGPAGGALRAANGDVILSIPPLALAEDVTVNVTELSDAPEGVSGIRVASYFDFAPDGIVLAVPAQATFSYRVPVAIGQVAATLAPAIDLVSLNEATGAWEKAATGVDTRTATFTGLMSHFSYWTGEIIQPHGTTSDKTDYCGTVCHNLTTAPGSPIVIPTPDKTVCYNCHGNVNSTDLPAGAHGVNIQAEFYDCADQTFASTGRSRHPVAEGKLYCVMCHSPHTNPSTSYKNLKVQDAATGRTIQAKADGAVGNAYCFACHGTKAQARANYVDPGYYTRAGDHKTGFTQSVHGTVTAPTQSGITCLRCHSEHAADSAGLVPGGANKCYECHKDPAAGGIQNNAISGASLADDIEQAFGFSYKHTLGATFTAGGADYTLTCGSCHNAHIATGKYSQADQGKTPLSRFTSPTALFGVVAGQKLNDYVGSTDRQYQKPNADLFAGSVLPDYDSYCGDCHNASNDIWSPTLGRLLKKFDFQKEEHGWYVASDDLVGSAELRSPYADASVGGYVLSCTDCHEGHGSANNYFMRKWVNNETVTVTNYGNTSREWDSLCQRCHSNVSPAHHRSELQSTYGCTPCHAQGGYTNCTDCHFHGNRPSDTIAPIAASLAPTNGATNVAVGVNLTYTLADTATGVSWPTAQISLLGDQGYARIYTDDDTSVVSRTGTLSSYQVAVNPTVDFGNGEVITVTLGAQDLAGNSLLSPAWSFTTAP